MRKYRTGLISMDYFDYDCDLCKGNCWCARYKKLSRGGTEHNGKIYPWKELVIESSNDHIAKAALTLICSSIILINPEFDAALDELKSQSIAMDYVPLAVMVAARASHRRRFVYAIHKFRLASKLLGVKAWRLNPERWSNLSIPKCPLERVQVAQSVLLYYSCLEEIGLEIHASERKPSLIKGAWNPLVRADLEERLGKYKIDITEKLLWMRRNKPTRIERVEGFAPPKPFSWNNRNVRDTEIDLVDGIRHISFIRSKIAAHRFGRLLPSLSVYNAGNAQHLARRLLMESLGFWPCWPRNASKRQIFGNPSETRKRWKSPVT